MTYLFAAFAIAWAMLFGYAVHLNRMQRRLEGELSVLRRASEGQG
jgi:CcmD family protein